MPSHADILAAAQHLRRGGIVAFPTETVYGLGADAFNEAAVGRVFELKGRPPTNPLIVHVTGREMARGVVSQWPPAADRLAQAFWPGPLTIVLAKAPELPEIVTAGGPTAAVRCPDHPVALALLFALERPLVGPSANPSGRISPTRAEHVRESFSEDDVMILDAGACVTGIESTVLDISADPSRPRILRRGVIGPHQIADALGIPHHDVQSGSPRPIGTDEQPLPSPGLLSTHYAPRAEALLFQPAQWPDVQQLAETAAARGDHIALLSHARRSLAEPHAVFTLPRQAGAYASVLYEALRRADATGPSLIVVESPPQPDSTADPAEAATWAAVHDRLSRATRPL